MTYSSLAPNLALLGQSAGGPSTSPQPGLGLRLGLGGFPAASRQLTAHLNLNLNLNESRPLRGRAFSLVELLAVVGIVAIVSVAAVPVMRGLGGAQSSRAAAQILVSAFEQARTAAILSGTNAYLVLPDSNTTTMTATNVGRSYAVIRHKVDADADNRDDFLTNFSANWILLSKWERLPGDIVFDDTRLRTLAQINPTGLSFPGNSNSSRLRFVGFNPSGGLTPETLGETTNSIRLLFYSQSRNTNIADGIRISKHSGRVVYVGLITNTNNF